MIRLALRYSIRFKLIAATLTPLLTAVIVFWVISATALHIWIPELTLLDLRFRVNIIFLAILLFATLIGIIISTWLGSSLARPIRAVEEGARQLAMGEHIPDIVIGGHDEISVMAEEFNIMKHRLIEREDEIRLLNRNLEKKVAERTAQLEENNQWLLVAQQELARAERLTGIGLLASGVAHEINNPLAIIRGNTELLEIACCSQGCDEVETIYQQLGRIERIVRNLLEFSRGSTRQVTLFSIADVLNDILNQVKHQINLGGFKIIRDFNDASLLIEADEGQIRQVFTNLILNGLQAMGVSGVLTVIATIYDEKYQVVVRDTGPGIEAVGMEKLFSPFYSTKSNGTGLGLAVSYGIVKDHGGEIKVESATGEGAAFTVLLPLRQTVLDQD